MTIVDQVVVVIMIEEKAVVETVNVMEIVELSLVTIDLKADGREMKEDQKVDGKNLLRQWKSMKKQRRR